MNAFTLSIASGLFILATISGMLGLGVAFAAVPFLSLFFDDLVSQVQPLTLLLNGLTACFAALGFARSGYVQTLTITLLVAGACGAFMGARISSVYVSEKWLKLTFAGVIFLLTGYRFYTILI